MKYEMMMILKPMLPEDIRNNLLDKIEDMLKKIKGNVISKDVWGKRHLAYPIKSQEEGYYIVYELEMPEEKAPEFQHELKFMNDILRFLFIKQDKV